MALQVLLICTATVMFCAGGLFLMESFELISITAISMQPNVLAKGSICLLMGEPWMRNALGFGTNHPWSW
eukprot:g27963.t1